MSSRLGVGVIFVATKIESWDVLIVNRGDQKLNGGVAYGKSRK